MLTKQLHLIGRRIKDKLTYYRRVFCCVTGAKSRAEKCGKGGNLNESLRNSHHRGPKFLKLTKISLISRKVGLFFVGLFSPNVSNYATVRSFSMKWHTVSRFCFFTRRAFNKSRRILEEWGDWKGYSAYNLCFELQVHFYHMWSEIYETSAKRK